MGEENQELLILAFGNPLLDMTVVVEDTAIHEKFNLPTDGQLEITDDQRPLFDIVMKREDVQFTAGGCALNTLRIFSWAFGEPYKACFVGGIGVDEKANELSSILKESGVVTHFVYVKDKPTGTCSALVLGAQRCLCADIGAAAVCKPSHVFQGDSCKLLHSLGSPHVIYLEGYFITHSFDTTMKIASYCRENGKTFIFNLCGSYVCENYFDELLQILPFIDVIFGYIEEYKTLQKFISLDNLCEEYSGIDNIVHVLKQIFNCLSGKENLIIREEGSKANNMSNGEVDTVVESSLGNGSIDIFHKEKIQMKKLGQWNSIKHQKLAIVTQGPNPLLYAVGHKVYERKLAPMEPSKIIDTTGAGDSFVGGFLAASGKGEDLETCLDCGVWTAQQILQEKGCTIPIQSTCSHIIMRVMSTADTSLRLFEPHR
ncbi:UNVERIFIED_CONTAM: hypothetical protein RMT77_008410 [Armadillidium vulgare]